jgi:hypothetical protein
MPVVFQCPLLVKDFLSVENIYPSIATSAAMDYSPGDTAHYAALLGCWNRSLCI